jgi:release factor glutamine methyltransferase
MYPVSEDSLFLAEVLKDYLKETKNKDKIEYLDMGTGSGILSEIALKYLKKENILAVDIDKECVKHMKKVKCIHSNLFSKVKGKFNIITFNAPYLPEDKYDKKLDTTGGKEGDEVSLKFIRQAKNHLSKRGVILLLISSLTPFYRIKKFKPKIIAKKKLFFEELLVLEFR